MICFSAVFVVLVGADVMLVSCVSSTLTFTCGKEPCGFSPAVSISKLLSLGLFLKMTQKQILIGCNFHCTDLGSMKYFGNIYLDMACLKFCVCPAVFMWP